MTIRCLVSDERLDAIQVRYRVATAAPWVAVPVEYSVLGETFKRDEIGHDALASSCVAMPGPDSDFIREARCDVPDLLSDVLYLKWKLKDAQLDTKNFSDALDRLRHDFAAVCTELDNQGQRSLKWSRSTPTAAGWYWWRSPEHGAQIAKQCEICHNLQEGQGPKVD